MELGYGNGTSIPTGIDTSQTYVNVSNPRPDSSSRIDAELANDLLAAMLALEVDLFRTRVIDARTYTTFTEAVAAAANKTLFVCSSINLDANTIIPNTVSLLVTRPGIINANGKILTINGPVVGGPMHQWLSGFAAGGVTFGAYSFIAEISPVWWGLAPTANATINSLAIHCAIASTISMQGGDVIIPPHTYDVRDITFGSYLGVRLIGSSPKSNYGASSGVSRLYAHDGDATWCLRIPEPSAAGRILNEVRDISLYSNGDISTTPPHNIITPGVEYGLLVESNAVVLENVTSFGFQYGGVQTCYGIGVVYDRCTFFYNTKVGFAVTTGQNSAYDIAHPNLIATKPTLIDGVTTSTVMTFRDCIFRKNGWGVILRDGVNTFEGGTIVEGNYFGGLLTYKGSLDNGVSVQAKGNIHFENNWTSSYDKNANYTVTQNNLLKDTASVYMPWVNAYGDTDNTITGTGAGADNKIRLTISGGTSRATGDNVTIQGVLGTTEANGTFVVTYIDATHIDLDYSLYVNAYTSGGLVSKATDAGYQLYSMADISGTTYGPSYCNLYGTNFHLGNDIKAVYIKQGLLWAFYNCSATGNSDSSSDMRLGNGVYLANAIHFYDFNGSLPNTTILGNRGASFRTDRSYHGGLTVDVGSIKSGTFTLTDGVSVPATFSGIASIYIDSADGDLKIKFGDGTVKTIVVDT